MIVVWFDRQPLVVRSRHWANDSAPILPWQHETPTICNDLILETSGHDFMTAFNRAEWGRSATGDFWLATSEYFWRFELAAVRRMERMPGARDFRVEVGVSGLIRGDIDCPDCMGELTLGSDGRGGDFFWMCKRCDAGFDPDALFLGMLDAHGTHKRTVR